MSGMLVHLTNAKMIIFDLTVYSTFVIPYSKKLSDLFIVAAWLLIAGPGANLVYMLTGSYLKPFLQQYQRKVDIVSALALGLCALFIVLY